MHPLSPQNSDSTQEASFAIADALAGARSGNEEAFRWLFDHLSDAVFRYIASRISSREEALDVTQEVFLDLWRALAKFQYRSEREFYSFVFTIARKKIAKWHRKQKKEVPLEESYVEENYEISYKDYRELWQWIAKLKPKYQELLRLRYVSDLSFAEVAAALGIREGTAKVWHHRAIKKLQEIAQQSL